jgi:lysozyme family protein
MKRLIGWSIAVLAVLFLAAQMKTVERSNPPGDPSRSLWAQAQVPPEVADILRRACNDCHSNETRWPWYSRVAPVSWFVTGHVNHGRRHLNFSDWVTVSSHTGASPEQRLARISEEVSEGGMPLQSYTWLHPDARLTKEEVRAVSEWAQKERLRIR